VNFALLKERNIYKNLIKLLHCSITDFICVSTCKVCKGLSLEGTGTQKVAHPLETKVQSKPLAFSICGCES
jgi:hypothetical protein